MISHPENPDFTANSSNSFWVLSFPPGFWANMTKSCSHTIFDETLFSGTTGRIDSTMISFPAIFEKFQAMRIAPIMEYPLQVSMF